MIGVKPPVIGMLLVLLPAVPSYAADNKTATESPKLQKCLQRADDLPDMAAAESALWIDKGGGNEAHLCHAFAQSNRGMHKDAAHEFWSLASAYDKSDRHRAILMHDFSGLEFLLAKDLASARVQYEAALKIYPLDSRALVGRAKIAIEDEKYWDALHDLNQVLKKDSDDIDALRQRGLVWRKLDNPKNAQEDFAHVEALEGESK